MLSDTCGAAIKIFNGRLNKKNKNKEKVLRCSVGHANNYELNN